MEDILEQQTNSQNLKYRLPTLGDEAVVEAFLAEHAAHGETDVLYGQDVLQENYSEWLALIEKNATEGNGDWGKSLLYLCFDGPALVGALTIRHEITPEVAAVYGHIGYVVRPSLRNKGYATRMLAYALDVCREQGLQTVILGCYKANTPSAAVIKKCGGKLVAENDNYTAGTMSQYYEIAL